MTPGISTFWLAITPGIRLGIVLLVFLFIFRGAILYVVKQFTPFLAKMVTWVLSLFFVIFEYILGLLFRIFGKKIEAKWAQKYERFVQKLLMRLNQSGDKWKNKFSNQAMVKKKFKFYAVFISLFFMLVSYPWPNFPLVKSLTDFEANILHEKLKIDRIATVDARAMLVAWTESWSADESEAASSANQGVPAQLTLTPDNSRGNIREMPAMGAKILRTIHTGESVAYLNEQSVEQGPDGQSRTWFKVQSSDGITGWISSNIVQ